MKEAPVDDELDAFRVEARAWLAERLEPCDDIDDERWGVGSDSVAIFEHLDEAEERAAHEAAAAWQHEKFDAGWGALAWPRRWGGRELTMQHEAAFAEEERRFRTPHSHEVLTGTLRIMAPTVSAFGTVEQQERFLPPFLRADELCCQLFSEPQAGSDLASLGCRAVRDGDRWIIDGQKVWTSGAHLSEVGLLLARTDPTVEKHAGITAFLVPMDAPGVEVRPIRQMTGGTCFNEVFFTEAVVDDDLRLGPEGEGWKVGIATLGFERAVSGAGAGGVGGSYTQVAALAAHLGRTSDPLVRQDLAALYTADRIAAMTNARIEAATEAGQGPGPVGSIGKLAWTQRLTMTSEIVGRLLGPRIAADTGEWGTFAWTEHLLGAPGYRIAGGSDEIQRSIIAQRVLGLPRDPQSGQTGNAAT